MSEQNAAAASAALERLGDDGYAAEFAIEDAAGLHARPAADFVRQAGGYEAAVTVRHGDRQADAKSMLMVLGLAAGQGARIRLEARGADAELAVRELAELLAPQAIAAAG